MNWTREGGFRWNWLARRTKGRFGLGRWTQAELDRIHQRATESRERFHWIDPPKQGEPQ